MFSIAFYGKGGIGKSTISSNVSYVLSSKGRVLHIGCDPKHDSTRLLLPSGHQPTVLDTVSRGGTPSDLSQVAVVGKGGVYCVESGGPEPGVGCAGRGIITTFNILEDLGIEELHPDFRIFDVLGDVVCGGFAIPMRSDRSDGIIIVTSGEFMSIFAANNILKGIRRLDGEAPRLIGVVQNSRGVENEDALVEHFAQSVSLSVIAKVPRSKQIAICERENEPLQVLFPNGAPAREIRAVAEAIVEATSGQRDLLPAKPLDDDQMEVLLHGGIPPSIVHEALVTGTGPVIRKKDVLETCSAAGAVDIGYFIEGMDILLHSPDSCAYIFSSFHDRMSTVDPSYRRIAFVPSGDRMNCTGLTDADSIFGGSRKLDSKLDEMISAGSRDIMVITTCMAGIIGDDVRKVVKDAEDRHPGVRITLVKCDGNMTGHMGEGLYLATRAMFRYIDQAVVPDRGSVNILSMSFMRLSYKNRIEALEELLDLFDLRINCMFIGGCTIDQIVNLKRGSMNLVVSDIPLARQVAEELDQYCGIAYLMAPAPTGLKKTCEWLRALGKALGRTDTAEKAVHEVRSRYERLLADSTPFLRGKRVAIYCDHPKNISWAVDFITDAGAEMVYTGFGPSVSKRSRDPDVGRTSIDIRTDYSTDMVVRDFPVDRLDLLIARDQRLLGLDCHHMELTDGYMGMEGLRELARRMRDSFIIRPVEGWRLRSWCS